MKRIMIFLCAIILSAALLLSPAGAACAEGSAPVAENLELRTYRNVSVGGRLSAFDPDDDELCFEISTEPVKGSVELEENGVFVYTPKENKRGRDYFGYRAVDSEGNRSQEATVIIRIEKQKKAVSYSDLQGSGYEYAALALSENEIFTGEQIGGQYCFYPDRSVDRGEFVSMCMLLTEREPLQATLRTAYGDDTQIPAWMKGYLTAAALAGIGEGEESFRASDAITVTEAAAILDRALDLTEIRYMQAAPETTQSCINLKAHGIPTGAGQILSRGEAARMLAAALEFLNK